MPLPADSTLSLLPHTNPGESEYTKPKQALIIRMSEEVLDALQSYGSETPPVEFDFGNTPGIYIGGAFYPMSGTGESGHELYLRTTSASKPSPPLKHYANVTHKYAVGLSQRDEAKAAGRIRERVNDAAKQKEEHKTVFLDAPPPLTPSSSNTSAPAKKKRKDPTSSMFRTAMKNSDKATSHRTPATTGMSTSSTPTPATSAPTRVASPAPPRKRGDLQDHPRRKALIHCLAVNSERSRDNLTKAILGTSAGVPSAQQDFYELLEDVAEPTSNLRKGEDPANQRWRLKTESWPEVRPYDWPKWAESDRISVARTGRQKLHALGIRSTDAAWKHFEHRQNNNNSVASSSSSSSSNPNTTTHVEAKRGVTSMDMKEKEKRKAKADSKAEIKMRDEGARAVAASTATSRPSSAPGKSRASEESPRPQAPPPLRTGAGGKKLPGSGYKAASLASPTASPSPTATTVPLNPFADTRGRTAKETPPHALPPKPSPVAATSSSNKPDRNPVTGLPNKRIGKTRDVAMSGVESDRERPSDRAGTSKSRPVQEKGKSVDSREGSSLKRKQVAEDDDDYEDSKARALAAKKRKIEAGSTPSATPPTLKDTKPRDLTLPKKPELTPGAKPKVKKEASPLPPLPPSPKVKREREQSPAIRAAMTRESKAPTQTSSSHRRSESVRTNGSGKSRRKSPIYTSSSEDEGEIRRPTKTTSLPTPSPNGDHDTHRHVKQESKPQPLPKDRAALRARYKESYTEYIDLYGQIRTQRIKIEKRMLQGPAGSDSGDVLSDDELKAKTVKFDQLSKDLNAIRAMVGS